MDAQQFFSKVWFPLGLVAVAVTFWLAFLKEEHGSDNLVALIVGGTIWGLVLVWALTRRGSSARS